MNFNLALCVTTLPARQQLFPIAGSGAAAAARPGLPARLRGHHCPSQGGSGDREVRAGPALGSGEAACQQVDELESRHHGECKGLPIRLNQAISGARNVLLKHFITRRAVIFPCS